jgi:hypothetical protein
MAIPQVQAEGCVPLKGISYNLVQIASEETVDAPQTGLHEVFHLIFFPFN